jgi:hypothetical protein
MTLWETLSTLGLGTVLGGIVHFEYRRYRENQQEEQDQVKNWFDESLDIIGRGAYNIDRARFRGDPDYDRILEDLHGFSERLYVKSKNPPDPVPQSAVNKVRAVAQMYAKATAVAEVNSEKEGKELVTELFEMSKKENYSEVEFEEILENAAKISPELSELISEYNQIGIEVSEIAEAFEYIMEDWDSEDFEQFIIEASMENNDVNESIQWSMSMFFSLASNISNIAYDELQSNAKEIR